MDKSQFYLEHWKKLYEQEIWKMLENFFVSLTLASSKNTLWSASVNPTLWRFFLQRAKFLVKRKFPPQLYGTKKKQTTNPRQ